MNRPLALDDWLSQIRLDSISSTPEPNVGGLLSQFGLRSQPAYPAGVPGATLGEILRDDIGLRRGGLGAVAPQIAAPPPPVQQRKWIAVTWRFKKLHENIQLSPDQYRDATGKAEGVAQCLRSHYWGANCKVLVCPSIGSWAKNTVVRPPRDVDLHFVLPYDVYARFHARAGNKQSALLQEVKGVLERTYSTTDMNADRQIVLVKFGTWAVEVVPALYFNEGVWICDTKGQGSYKKVDPQAEVNFLNQVDANCSGNLRPLIRMLKTWQRACNVPIKSFHLELLAAEFLASSRWRSEDFFYFDWIIRDFFAYIWSRANGSVVAPGTYEVMSLGNDWQSRTLTAWDHAVKACDFEHDNAVVDAGREWQKIFGCDIPLIW